MKSIFISILFLLFSYIAKSQVDIINENFDFYTPGDLVAETIWLPWTTRTFKPGSSEDAPFSTDVSSSGSNSMRISGPAATQGPDMVMVKLGNVSTGDYTISLKVFVASAKGGIIAIHRTEIDTTDTKHMFFIGFRGNGSAAIIVENSIIAKNFNHNVDTWIDMRFEFDLDNEIAEIYIDEVLEYTHSAASAGQLGSLEFFSYSGSSGAPSLMYIDDVVVTDNNATSIQEISADNINIYPNPAQDILNIELNNVGANAVVSIIDTYGKTYTSLPLSYDKGKWAKTEVDVSFLTVGVYLIKITSDEKQGYYRFVKQ